MNKTGIILLSSFELSFIGFDLPIGMGRFGQLFIELAAA